MPNIRVNLWVCAYDGETNLSGEAYGYTNQYGYAIVTYYIDGEYDPELEFMEASVMNPPYSTLYATGNRTTSSSTIYPEFWIWIDLDEDDIRDEVEVQIADKFKPVLHKHSYDLSQGLANFEKHIIDGKFTQYIYNNGGEYITHYVVSGSANALHKWGCWQWDTYGAGTVSWEVYKLDLENSVRYSSALTGQRPIYYHVYKEDSYYYVQYWYYFGMNDIQEQIGGTWHESDWEHVSIRLTKNGDVFTPDKVNFYIHEGGMTFNANQCWWSTYPSLNYSNLQQSYDENHTHLHIWIAANAHASYNRYSVIYKITGYIIYPQVTEYRDRLDYEPSGYDLYFPYDQLINLGEVSKEFTVKCPESGYWLEFHSYPIGTQSKHWLSYRGRTGFSDGLPGAKPHSPFMPAKEESSSSHEWMDFTDFPFFGNPNHDYILIQAIVTWIWDDSIGD